MILKGRAAVVTGLGVTGCGRAIALRLAGEGALVVASDINVARTEEAVRLVHSSGGRAVLCFADARKEEQARRDLMAFEARMFGP
jgi:NAD(P)-dependent dehydrogenase (short-subunit alcohol dehydrogenase family)